MKNTESQTPEQQLTQALDSANPAQAIEALARQLCKAGHSLETLYTHALDQHRDSPDEEKWNALTGTLDYITGYCSPSKRLFRET